MEQIGMNVKMWIDDPVSDLFRELDARKHENFRGGFEPIPDVCLFSRRIKSDWRRRNAECTMAALLLAIEVKASERQGARLRSGEIIRDINKLAAHRQEAQQRNASFVPVMMVIDTAPTPEERMTSWALSESREACKEVSVEFMYVSPTEHSCSLVGGNKERKLRTDNDFHE
ncbi:hypothetical protein [uncultured Thiodictyon sp.]|uniref:hypothetical protein n=1 Tax=uncultured Thiodictyon sp. TaxID=1846217 RepID=UPI0025E7D93F|nr:hypothetical protein [uncultured Thiodictyon sp.]